MHFTDDPQTEVEHHCIQLCEKYVSLYKYFMNCSLSNFFKRLKSVSAVK
jgi:hypothetical protein